MLRFTGTRILFASILILASIIVHGQGGEGYLKGTIRLDSSWEQKMYLSHIPTFEDMYAMSRDMIISSTDIDSAGRFEFDLGFLPDSDNFFRLHLVKEGDSPSSLIIGGNDENHIFLCASRNSRIVMRAGYSSPPFSNVVFDNSRSNKNIQMVTDLVHNRTTLAEESDAAKRRFIENDLRTQLATIADSTSDYLLGLYALYNRDGEIDYESDPELYDRLYKKWENQKSPYLEAFQNKVPKQEASNITFWLIAGGLLLLVLGFGIGRIMIAREPVSADISKLSIQERKIFDLLRQGASNQEISNECNIGVSTVKSHVSSIYSKLKVRSRKEVMNLP